jgi:membrane-associated protease RseP (regulator of RpoE activity)
MWLKPYVDPYGCVSAAIGGTGWGSPVDVSNFVRRPGGRVVAQLLAGPVVLCALGVAALLAFQSWTGFDFSGSGELLAVVHGDAFATSHVHYAIGFGEVALFLAGVEWLTMGILAIMPLPPLDGGKLLFALVPRTLGWQRAHYRLDEENWGALILLVLALPIIVRTPILIQFLGRIVDPIVGAIT